MAIDITEDYLDFCATDRQKEIIEWIVSNGNSPRACARALNTSHSYVIQARDAVIKRAALHGFSPEHDMDKPAPNTHIVKGTSTLYDDEGKKRLQWVKTNVKMEEMLQHIKDAAEAAKDDLPRIEQPAPPVGDLSKDIIPWIQIGDAHIGMLANIKEVGHNFDMKIGELELCTAIAYLISVTPACERCVVQDLGDFTHYENIEGVTEASKHSLDVDGRYKKMIRVYIRTMRFIIEEALKKFKYVDVIINQGNHSRKNDLWAHELLTVLYADCDRVTAVNNESVFIPYRMGNTFVMSHHSDKCKPAKLVDVMSTDFHQDWGESKFRYVDIGHIHHGCRFAERAGATIESWNQMAPSDKYAHDGGWRSRQLLTVVDRSKTYGEVARRSITGEQVKDMIENAAPGESCKKRREVYTV